MADGGKAPSEIYVDCDCRSYGLANGLCCKLYFHFHETVRIDMLLCQTVSLGQNRRFCVLSRS